MAHRLGFLEIPKATNAYSRNPLPIQSFLYRILLGKMNTHQNCLEFAREARSLVEAFHANLLRLVVQHCSTIEPHVCDTQTRTIHKPTPPPVLHCPQCLQPFNRRNNLDRHWLITHAACHERCQFCDLEIFQTRTYLSHLEECEESKKHANLSAKRLEATEVEQRLRHQASEELDTRLNAHGQGRKRQRSAKQKVRHRKFDVNQSPAIDEPGCSSSTNSTRQALPDADEINLQGQLTIANHGYPPSESGKLDAKQCGADTTRRLMRFDTTDYSPSSAQALSSTLNYGNQSTHIIFDEQIDCADSGHENTRSNTNNTRQPALATFNTSSSDPALPEFPAFANRYTIDQCPQGNTELPEFPMFATLYTIDQPMGTKSSQHAMTRPERLPPTPFRPAEIQLDLVSSTVELPNSFASGCADMRTY